LIAWKCGTGIDHDAISNASFDCVFAFLTPTGVGVILTEFGFLSLGDSLNWSIQKFKSDLDFVSAKNISFPRPILARDLGVYSLQEKWLLCQIASQFVLTSLCVYLESLSLIFWTRVSFLVSKMRLKMGLVTTTQQLLKRFMR
jgi:hypothetical protein